MTDKRPGESSAVARLRIAQEKREAAELDSERMRRLLPSPVARYANPDCGCRFTATGVALIGFLAGAAVAGAAFAAVLAGAL